MIGLKLGNYEIRARIGAGGMGEVYRAHDPRLGRDVALKLLPPDVAAHADRLSRFEREAKALAAMNHPNIVTIHSIEEAEGRRFLTMELIDGETLAALVHDRRRDLREILRFAVALADALSAAHEKGIVHRDLKPSNVMITRDGRLKVLDFGLAKPTGPEVDKDEAATMAMTEPVSAVGGVVGTAPYMAPEQIRGETLDARADLFAFGILLYEILTGQRPFRGDTTADVTSAILRDTPAPPRSLRADVPGDLERIVQRCLAKDRDRRFQTAKDVRNELDIVMEELSSGSAAATVAAATPEAPAPSPASPPPSAGPEASIVAILFFENLSGDPQDAFFCEGMTEDLITEASRIAGLTVFPRSTVAPYRGSDWPSLDVARHLGASHFVEGSMRRAGDRLRVTARLVEAHGGHAVWSERFDRQMEDVFDIQDDIARSVARALRVRLTDSDERQLQRGGTRNLAAYEYYLRGRGEFRQTGIIGSAEVADYSVAMFRKAIGIDPDYARAWAGIAEYRAVHVMWHGGGESALVEARDAAERALRLEPDLPEALVARAMVLQLDRRIEESRDHFMRAAEVQPRLWEIHYLRGRMEFSVGQTETAVACFRRGAEIDPEDVQCCKLLVMSLEGLGRDAEARVEAEGALVRIHHRLELEPNQPFLLDARAQMLSTLGRRKEAMRFAEEAVARTDLPPTYRYNAACLFAKGGRMDRAKEILVGLLKTGFGDRTFILNDPDIAAIVNDPEVRALLDSRDGGRSR